MVPNIESGNSIFQIVTKPNWWLTMDLVNGTKSTNSKNNGQLNVPAEEVFVSKTTTELTLKCSDLKNKDFFSNSLQVVNGGLHFQHLVSELHPGSSAKGLRVSFERVRN